MPRRCRDFSGILNSVQGMGHHLNRGATGQFPNARPRSIGFVPDLRVLWSLYRVAARYRAECSRSLLRARSFTRAMVRLASRWPFSRRSSGGRRLDQVADGLVEGDGGEHGAHCVLLATVRCGTPSSSAAASIHFRSWRGVPLAGEDVEGDAHIRLLALSCRCPLAARCCRPRGCQGGWLGCPRPGPGPRLRRWSRCRWSAGQRTGNAPRAAVRVAGAHVSPLLMRS